MVYSSAIEMVKQTTLNKVEAFTSIMKNGTNHNQIDNYLYPLCKRHVLAAQLRNWKLCSELFQQLNQYEDRYTNLGIEWRHSPDDRISRWAAKSGASNNLSRE